MTEQQLLKWLQSADAETQACALRRMYSQDVGVTRKQEDNRLLAELFRRRHDRDYQKFINRVKQFGG